MSLLPRTTLHSDSKQDGNSNYKEIKIVLQNVKLQNAEFQNIELQNAELQNAEVQNIKSYRTSNLTKLWNTKCRILQNVEIQNVENTKHRKLQKVGEKN